ncbi:MAG: HDIG domain-containing protein [Clostridia bacterium]
MMFNKRPVNKKKHRSSWESLGQALRSRTAQCAYVLLLGTALMCVLFLLAITPQRYDLKVGDIAHSTITASKDVVDEISTARQREEASKQVEPTYLFKEGVSGTVLQSLDNVFTQAGAVQQYGRKMLEQYAPQDTSKQNKYVFAEAELEYAKSLLTLVPLADYQINTLLRASDQQMLNLEDNLFSAVENTLNTTIREGYVNESIQYLQQIIGYKTEMDLLQNVVTPILRKVIQPNMVVDQDATAKLQEEARATVDPVIYKQGQNIVLARERVTANQLEMLRSLGLLDNDTVDVMMYMGGLLMVFLSVVTLLAALALWDPHTLRNPKRLTIIMMILCLSLGICILGQMVQTYMAPTLLAVMMLTGLLNAGVGAAGACSMAVLVSALIAGGDSTYGSEMINLLFTTLISGFFAVIIIRRKPYRQQVLLCGILTAISNIVIILAVGFMTNTSISYVFSNALWSASGALTASVLCVALDPMIESFFHLATSAKLLELSNPNHPLLRRLLIEASGTYHHSIIVANLAEAAAEAVGANPLLARAGGYFHDIGKLKRPLYFKENQIGENPHEHTNPYVSAAIVTAHTRDGLIMAQQYHLPQEIQDIIIEHHGDTPVMYFYHKALQQADGQAVDIADFRYDGKRPHTKESAIIMLADTVEAAVRSMPDPTPKAIEEFIARLVRSKLDDGQLNNAPLTLRNITKICETFSTVLNGVFHERIEYPSISPSAAAHVAALTQAEESPVEAQELHRVTDENPERAAEQLVEEVAAQAEHASDEVPADSGEAADEQAMLDARKLAQAPADANDAEESRKSDAEKPEAQDDH